MITRTSPIARANNRFDGDSRHAGYAGIAGVRQEVPIDLQHRKPRQDHVAEPAPACRPSPGWSTATPGIAV